MVLTREEEARLLADYSNIVWKIVNRFCAGKSSAIFDRDDLHQEGMILLINHMKNAKTHDELKRFQTMDLVNVMTRYVLKSQAVRLDANRTSTAKQTLSNLSGTVCYESISLAANEEDRDALIDFDAFVETLTPKQRDIILLKRKGYSNAEIARMRNICDQSVGETIKRAYRAYAEFAA